MTILTDLDALIAKTNRRVASCEHLTGFREGCPSCALDQAVLQLEALGVDHLRAHVTALIDAAGRLGAAAGYIEDGTASRTNDLLYAKAMKVWRDQANTTLVALAADLAKPKEAQL